MTRKTSILTALLFALLTVLCSAPAQARFLTPDTWDPTLPGVDINRYAYSGNDPVNGSDPGGHCWSCVTQEDWDVYNMERADALHAKVDAIRGRENYNSAFQDMIGFDETFDRWASDYESKIGQPPPSNWMDTSTQEAIGAFRATAGARQSGAGGTKSKGPSVGSGKTANLWKTSSFEGRKVYKRDGLIDPNKTDTRGRTNRQRMQEGLAPIGPDNNTLNLHHIGQRDNSPVIELTKTLHEKYRKQLHINPTSTGSGINRRRFDAYRERYWQNRARDFPE